MGRWDLPGGSREDLRRSLKRIFSELEDDVLVITGHYEETHISNEEAFIESIEYPHLEEHRKIQEVFRREVHKLLPAIESGDYHAITQALSLCRGWLYNHIAKPDKKYGEYAREKGLI